MNRPVHRLLVLCLAALVASCGGLPRAPAKVHEQGLIAPDQKIAVLWALGSFSNSNVNLALRRENTYGKSYELCTNALVEQTFRANGYAALARKVETGERPVVPADVRYVLFLRSTQVRFLSNPQGTAASPFPGVLIDVEGDLLDRKTGKRLWTVYNWLASDAKKNSVPSVHLVRALAADGYLKIKPNEVVDYLGGRAKSEDDIATGCP